MYKTTYRTVNNGQPAEIEIDVTSFRPDWTAFWSSVSMEKELPKRLGHSFTFQGPGWYILDQVSAPASGPQNTLLIIPTKEEHDNQQIFFVCGWNHHDVGAAFSWICNAPVRIDER